MSIAIASNASNLHALEMWQATVANNLANSSVPGFQKTLFAVSGSEMRSRTNMVPGANALNPGVERSTMPGPIKVTGNPLDFAISGEGYFSFQGPEGERLYSRNGEFHIDSTGLLVSAQGFPVEGEGGPITIDQQLGPFTIDREGVVSQGGQQVGKIGIYEFNNPDALKNYQGVMFEDPDDKAQPGLMEFPTVYQGQLELSNVSPMQEMVSMIEISRAFEISQKVIQQLDERQEKTIQTMSS